MCYFGIPNSEVELSPIPQLKQCRKVGKNIHVYFIILESLLLLQRAELISKQGKTSPRRSLNTVYSTTLVAFLALNLEGRERSLFFVLHNLESRKEKRFQGKKENSLFSDCLDTLALSCP